MDARKKADNFLKIAEMFHLGDLPTEMPHPKTARLSHYANNDLKTAIDILKTLDIDVFQALRSQITRLQSLKNDICNTLNAGGRIFLCGCGATGRLSLSLEVFWRQQAASSQRESVISFMAGGDSALIKSIEKFEDHPQFGERQLEELGYRQGDMLIASSEGGETPFVIGAVEHALQLSPCAPYFLYCNPDHILVEKVERSKRVIENSRIEKINLYTGPMALSGSTRMQASTVLMLAIGLAMFAPLTAKDIAQEIDSLQQSIANLDFEFLKAFITAEADTYQSGNFILYTTNFYGITVLTDTTERSPTFSLLPFENFRDRAISPSLSYICLPEAENAPSAWRMLLGREPRALDWGDDYTISTDYLYGFDFSKQAVNLRQQAIVPAELYPFEVWRAQDQLLLRFQENEQRIKLANLSLLAEHTLVKMLLNIHSTLVMGKLGRYQDNIMIWVKPSNNKLIDRAIRYVLRLLAASGIIGFSYQDVAYAMFEEMETLPADDSIVLKTCTRLRQKCS